MGKWKVILNWTIPKPEKYGVKGSYDMDFSVSFLIFIFP